MIENIALRIAKKIKQANPVQTTSIEVMLFALIAIIGTGSVIAVSLLISVFFGTFIETVIVLSVFMLIRSITGGYHFKKAEYCTLISIVGAVGLTLIQMTDLVNCILLIVSLLLYLIFAPLGINQSRIFTKKHYPLLKIIALLIVGSNFFIGSHLLTLIYFTQSITLPLFLWKGGEELES